MHETCMSKGGERSQGGLKAPDPTKPHLSVSKGGLGGVGGAEKAAFGIAATAVSPVRLGTAVNDKR